MEMKYVVPDMAQSFGTLEFAGESDHVLTEIKITVEFSQEEATTFIQMCRKGKCCGGNSRAGWRKEVQV